MELADEILLLTLTICIPKFTKLKATDFWNFTKARACSLTIISLHQ